ncbi:uncharacterized protein N7477_002757 [Penicillium maclennaniae]|uniref:uncharacterized protein n=1 Tax=Penicillium maclennaniae TaxID=1343394 RepID=UPI002541C4E8|nr:uncharacterized protein N7477_002757 [Penicillium maclennaniae]KAJ5677124.1 hypothetical protein N7477_002757 [Penicillium maclennaniae]
MAHVDLYKASQRIHIEEESKVLLIEMAKRYSQLLRTSCDPIGADNHTSPILTKSPSFVFVLGQVGGTGYPAMAGIIAADVGVKVLQPMPVGLFSAAGVSWFFVPKSTLYRD